MAKYRKKPIEIYAIQWKPREMLLKEVIDFFGGLDAISAKSIGKHKGNLIIKTRKGEMIANDGDWIIREHFPTDDRKLYPCKPDIFEKTYEMVKDDHYLEACEDGKEMAMHGIHWTQETVEHRAETLRNLANIQPRPDNRPPSAYRYEN